MDRTASDLEPRVASAVTTAVGALVTDFDPVEFLQAIARSGAELLGAGGGGLLFGDRADELQLIASSPGHLGLVELGRFAAADGPCADCYHAEEAFSVTDRDWPEARWPAFVAAARLQCVRAVHVAPLRLRDTTLGTLHLFSSSARVLEPREAAALQALADLGTLGLMQERLIRRSHTVASQLQAAVAGQAVVEQAKGVLAATDAITPAKAYGRIRTQARVTNTSIHDVATDVVKRTMATDEH